VERDGIQVDCRWMKCTRTGPLAVANKINWYRVTSPFTRLPAHDYYFSPLFCRFGYCCTSGFAISSIFGLSCEERWMLNAVRWQRGHNNGKMYFLIVLPSKNIYQTKTQQLQDESKNKNKTRTMNSPNSRLSSGNGRPETTTRIAIIITSTSCNGNGSSRPASDSSCHTGGKIGWLQLMAKNKSFLLLGPKSS